MQGGIAGEKRADGQRGEGQKKGSRDKCYILYKEWA